MLKNGEILLKDKYSEYKTTIEPASIAEAKISYSE